MFSIICIYMVVVEYLKVLVYAHVSCVKTMATTKLPSTGAHSCIGKETTIKPHWGFELPTYWFIILYYTTEALRLVVEETMA